MQQIGTVWASLDRRKQIIVASAVVLVFLGILGMSRLATAPSMTLLYAGLESGAAGDIVRALDQRGITYEIRGGSIYVPGAQRDELRMTLASEGLPANGNRGYELLDSLSGFGTTSQMFDAAYWRAKEGELARTIVGSPHVSQARVHIANGSANPFQRSVAPTASVYLVPSGADITGDQAKAIRFLVASAVSGLAPEDVTVIDSNGAVIGGQDTAVAADTADDKSRQLRERVLRLVEARVGPGNAVVEVSVDTETKTESIRERRFDPKGRVAISTDVEERSDSARNQSSDVTVASNLPDGDGAGGDESNSTATETRERVNYEVSETELEVHTAPGSIKRLTVAVLVNGTRTVDASGAETFAPLPQAELDALQELVAAAVGFDAARGDVITLKSLDLPVTEPQGTLASSSMWQNIHLDAMSLIQMAVLAVVSLVLALFVIRPILMKPTLTPALLPAVDGAEVEPSVLTGEIAADDVAEFAALSQDGCVPALGVNAVEDPVERLRTMIGDKQEETVEILRSWLEEGEERV
ncbi:MULTISPECIES: flagellar basal-body MS-ring/collar protein FliF [unclassified Ruegeria]|uniref:flagellar basal-body MS-ring/collar protein FliF n=1 Tax=unclassified Ruegeria TaxID=2625375 RepID=UPI00149105A6|nr:flagellar M-ring protein FliF [Ruegeria sp. HKCCD7296]NOE41604.1 flagellar M-ring protein FliF [Ruegeria sp. HKCCD7319]